MKSICNALLYAALLGLIIPASAETDQEFKARTGETRVIPPVEDFGGRYREGDKEVVIPPAEYKKMLINDFNKYDKIREKDGFSYRGTIVEIIKENSYYANDGSEKEIFLGCLESDPYFNVRAACAHAVGEMNYKEGKDRIRKAILKETCIPVKLSMAEALINLEDKSAPEIYSELSTILGKKNAEKWDFGYTEKTDVNPKAMVVDQSAIQIENVRGLASKILSRGDTKMAKEAMKPFINDSNETVKTESRKLGLLP